MTISVTLTDQPVGVTVSADAGAVSVSAATVTAVQVGIGDTAIPTTHGGTHAAGGSDPIPVSASQIGSGTIATDRLGSGTASSSTYLRGDQTWAAVSGGGSLEYANLASFPATGASAVIYVARNTNKLYRWSGSAYVELSASEATAWANITDKPSTFAPSAHTHDANDLFVFDGSFNSTGEQNTSLFQSFENVAGRLAGKAPLSHTHAASAINSGTIATARLASGTASASTYLRGDQTWAAISTYTLPAATTSALGGVIVGAGLSVSSGTVSANVVSVAGRTGTVTLAHSDVGNSPSTLTQFTAAQNNLSLGTGGIVRISSNAAVNITGFAATSGGDARMLSNVGSFEITLKHSDAASTAANRILCVGNADFVIAAGGSAVIYYDETASRWRVG